MHQDESCVYNVKGLVLKGKWVGNVELLELNVRGKITRVVYE